MNNNTMRMRRLRQKNFLRLLLSETNFTLDDLIYPLFVTHGRGLRQEIDSMPGIYHISLDNLISEVDEIARLNIKAVMLFGIPESKSDVGMEAYDNGGIIQESIRVIKQTIPDIVIITDVCLCQYTTHGHCGIVHNNVVDNDASLEILGKIAVSQAEAGSDIIAPSSMMDMQVLSIRDTLDLAGFKDIPIMSYSAKYSSSFYGPFRSAVDSSPQFGDRNSYQINPANAKEAIREIELDINQGTDLIMVKPALSYLDIISLAQQKFDYPLAAFNTSGEYSMVKSASLKGWIDEKKMVYEIITSIKRAGANMIISYHAKDIASWFNNELD
ncbi:MAG: porphobilinogen synthase [Chloroflexi bacterium]|nr:porphobilinogen synthase [Chloroflexota bacterium]|tara:strand:- start:95 stop:1078 length:984 start_codon:yes stop_codon:yes gene_type:complete